MASKRVECCELAKSTDAILPGDYAEAWAIVGCNAAKPDDRPPWIIRSDLKPDSPAGVDVEYAPVRFCPFCGKELPT